MWLSCQDRLATKERLVRFGMLSNDMCNFCYGTKNLQHLQFDCRDMAQVWKHILTWLQLAHDPNEWTHELAWMMHASKSKSWRAKVLKATFAEIIY